MVATKALLLQILRNEVVMMELAQIFGAKPQLGEQLHNSQLLLEDADTLIFPAERGEPIEPHLRS
jgi:hypothetical protein